MTFRFLAITTLLIADLAGATDGYFRSPDLHGDLLVFTAEGDLWSYGLGDDSAQRLTTHPSLESGAAVSPDGMRVAFASSYEGAEEVYVMPVTGGVPQRLTYENDFVIVQGWTPDGKVLYSTGSRPAAPATATLKTVDPDTLETQFIPLADAFGGVVAGDPETVYFTQFGKQFVGDNTNTYRGGMSGTLWRFAPGSDSEAMRMLVDHEGSISRPMVATDTLYFLSDASGRDNLWAARLDGTEARQVTRHEDFSVRGASLDGERVVYQLGADIHLLNLASGESTVLDIRLTSDHPSMRESWETEPMKYMQSVRLTGTEDKVTITARGAAAIAGTGKSRLVSVGAPGDARLRNAARSHDGKSVYAISDTSGEIQLWRYPTTGATGAEQLTKQAASLLGTFTESPDGRWIARGDGYGGLWLLDVESGRDTRIVSDSDTLQVFTDMEWSPNSQLLAVSHVGKGDLRPRILLHDVTNGRQAYVTSDKYESGAPAFSRDSKWIYFLSNRKFDASQSSVWEDRDFGPSFDKRTEVFAHPLTSDAVFPFATPNELTPPPADEPEDKKEEEKPTSVDVDWDGLTGRVWQVPLESGDYADLAINDGFVYVLTAEADGAEIKSLKLEPEAEVEAFTDSVAGMELSVDGKKLLVLKKAEDEVSAFVVPAEAKFPEDTSKNSIQTAGWRIRIDPRAEWMQMFQDAWYMHREFFFDPDMRGVDWAAARDKYRPLAERVTDRYELNDVLAQMVGELNALHSQVRDGDVPEDPDAPAPSALGAVLSQTGSGVTVSRIYRHDREVPAEAPPLAQPDVDAAEGDRIVAINGLDVSSLADVHRALRNQAGKQVLLELERDGESVKTVVVPADASRDRQYRYNDWVYGNRSKVESAGEELGYLHLQAMGPRDAGSFARDFFVSHNLFSSHRKQGFVIDVRRNNGGNIDSWVIERLLRKAWMFWSYRSGEPITNMQNTFRGHLVVLADERTYSDGETFTAAIKALNIAPVIGKRTAGAGVWLTGRNRLSDGGIARVAEWPVFAMDGRWVVEGRGVSPTIEVDNFPHETFNGKDAQLEAAIDYLKRKIEEEPIPDLVPGPISGVDEPAHDP